jgi:hypothetical protein
MSNFTVHPLNTYPGCTAVQYFFNAAGINQILFNASFFYRVIEVLIEFWC